jgi:toxin HigB-1
LLDRLDAVAKPEDMNIPGYKFHRLPGARQDTYAVAVTGNWRITFRFDSEDAIDVDLEDYH